MIMLKKELVVKLLYKNFFYYVFIVFGVWFRFCFEFFDD